VGLKEIIVGDVRIQLLSPSLLRVERKGPKGFESRKTLLAVERRWPGVKAVVRKERGDTVIETARYRLRAPRGAASVRDIEITDRAGAPLASLRRLPRRFDFPAPHEDGRSFVLVDQPRVIPPPWGATPPPDEYLRSQDPLKETSGWDLGNHADDVYVFVHDGDHAALRREFLRLTGPIPLPPLFALGFWDSRYHPYTEKSALAVIDRYRREKIPLDVFVVDTDWRVGGSGGYDIETKFFPDMPRFLRACHRRNVKVMFNDHPQPNGMKPLEPRMLKFRWDGITGLLDQGLDFWWYDKNWHDIIDGPHPGMDRELWGQCLYWDAHARHRPGERPLLMSMRSEHPAGHRYPIWWTGDIHSTFSDLRKGILDSVNDGLRFMPWVHQDLGGHTGTPSTELYVRFLQFGCLSPITRVHCTINRSRYPWIHGKKVQRIVTEYINLRYRLLPMLYTAARRAHDDGTPVLRRCDLEWPRHKEARSGLQYLFGDDLLVAPMAEGDAVTIPAEHLRHDGGPGLHAEFFNNADLKGAPVHERTDATVEYPWLFAFRAPHIGRENFSVRWTGQLGPVPETGDYDIHTVSDDGVRLWIDGRLVIDNWTQHGPTSDVARLYLEAGRSYQLRLEYCQYRGEAVLHLRWRKPGDRRTPITDRAVWIPPGSWEDAWTGEVVEGPATRRVAAALWEIPLFIRRGAIIPLAPVAPHTAAQRWDPVTLEVFPPARGRVERSLYEDQGANLDYAHGRFRRTALRAARDGQAVELVIDAARGRYPGALGRRAWLARFHLAAGESLERVEMNGRVVRKGIKVLRPRPRPRTGPDTMPLAGAGSRPPSLAGCVVEVTLQRAAVGKRRVVRLRTTRLASATSA
jgi:hypothetical protein